MHETRDHAERRSTGAGGAWLLALATRLPPRGAQRPRPARPRAKAVIQIWMWGGPSPPRHLRPEARRRATTTAARSTSRSRPTCAGIQIGELLPLLAKQADKYSIIRSMTHGNNGHETAAYMVQTGRKPGDAHRLSRASGAVVSLFKGYDARLHGADPALRRADRSRRAASPRRASSGPRYKPFATGGDPDADAVRRRGHRRRRASPTSASATAASCCTRSTRSARRCRATAASTRCAASEEKAYDLILGDAGQGLRPRRRRRTSCATRYGRNTLRPVLPDGAAAGRARRALRHDQLQGLGHAQAALRDDAPQAARAGQGHGDAAAGPVATAGCSTAPSSGGAASSAARPKVQWEAPWNGGRGHFGTVLLARRRRRRLQGRAGRRRLRRHGRGGDASGPSTRAT